LAQPSSQPVSDLGDLENMVSRLRPQEVEAFFDELEAEAQLQRA